VESIEWQGSTSNHVKLRIEAKVLKLSEKTKFNLMCVDPATGNLYYFTQDQGCIKQEDLPEGAPKRLDFPQTEKPCMISIEAMYRDASNFKAFGIQHFTGTIDEERLDILLTCLWMDGEGFIPHQVGLKDLQFDQSWEIDFEASDHPWHEIEDVKISEAIGKHQSINHIIALARDRITQGWDEISAIIHLQDRQNQ